METTITADLSKTHQLVGELFKWPTSAEEWETYKLSQEQIDQFHELGYVANIQLLTAEQLDFLGSELAEIMDPNHPQHHLFYEFWSNESGDPDKVLFHALGAWRITQGFHDILWNPSFVMKAAQLLGGGVRFWHDQLFCKPAKHGGVVAWHQDYSYWTRTSPMQHLTCWVGIDDATPENGCLQYVERSHEWGLIPKPDLAGEMNGLFEFLTEEQKADFKPVHIPLKRGFCSFHHPLLVHGSEANDSEMSRRAFVLNVFKDGTLSETDEVLLKGVPVIQKGEKMEGQFFPLLTDDLVLEALGE